MNRAAFFRVEGTLIPRTSLHAAAWLVGNAQKLSEVIARLGNVALATPLALAGELQVGATATRVTWMGVRGMTEDRLAVLGEEYYEAYLQDDVLEVGEKLLEAAKKKG